MGWRSVSYWVRERRWYGHHGGRPRLTRFAKRWVRRLTRRLEAKE